MAARDVNVLFNPGPVNLAPEIKQGVLAQEYCHRQPEFLALYERTRTRLADLLGYPLTDYGLGLLHGSGTLAVDAALATFVRGRVLVVDNGLYCKRFVTSLERIGDNEVVQVDFGIGTPLDLDRVRSAALEHRPDWMAVVHHETTTGILNPLAELNEIAAETGARLVVDAVSSMGAHHLAGLGDVVCFNSSKCLEAIPGIAGVFWRCDLEPQPTLGALDVAAYSAGMASTPNVQAFVSLDIALDLLAAEDRPARYARLAHHVWSRGAQQFEPLLAEAHRSNVLTSFRLGGRTIEDLTARAASRRMVIYSGQGALREQIFRIANMGALIDEAVVDELFDVLA